MQDLYARSVFFVKNAERSLEFYTKTLGFAVDWVHQERGRPHVCQVSLLGFQIILNQTELPGDSRAGHGRVFIGVEDEQVAALRAHLEAHRIETTVLQWGAPTLAIFDLDENEIFIWLPEKDRAQLQERTT